MRPCWEQLRDLGIPYEARVASAHRTPDLVREVVLAARERGVQVIVAAAGMAAHLAGAVASLTITPVIAVPLAGSSLGGLDALLSSVQMPPGVPVATVAINGARNAALLAAQILALSDQDLAHRLEALRQAQAEKVLEARLDS